MKKTCRVGKAGARVKKYRKGKRFLIFLIVVLVVAGVIMLYFDRYVNPVKQRSK